jgi:hypothetical protein
METILLALPQKMEIKEANRLSSYIKTPKK